MYYRQLFYTNDEQKILCLLPFFRDVAQNSEFSMLREIPEYSRFVVTLYYYGQQNRSTKLRVATSQSSSNSPTFPDVYDLPATVQR